MEILKQRAKSQPRRIVFPEFEDPRVRQAATILADQKLCVPVLITGDQRGDIAGASGIETVSVNDPQWLEACATQLSENRKHKGLSRDAATDAARDPLVFAALLVKLGHADGAVAGSIATTANVIRAGLYGLGTLPGTKLVSSFFLMQLADRMITYADCGVVPDPDSNQLAEIAIQAAASHELLVQEKPRVALLSFSTLGSAQHQRVTKIREALAIVREKAPTLCVDGELQFDAAFSPEVAQRKAPQSDVAGQANVFIFPDLDSGNIAYKITQRIGGASAVGPIVQGLAKPMMDLSRGCSVDDIVDVAVIASVLSTQ